MHSFAMAELAHRKFLDVLALVREKGVEIGPYPNPENAGETIHIGEGDSYAEVRHGGSLEWSTEYWVLHDAVSFGVGMRASSEGWAEVWAGVSFGNSEDAQYDEAIFSWENAPGIDGPMGVRKPPGDPDWCMYEPCKNKKLQELWDAWNQSILEWDSSAEQAIHVITNMARWFAKQKRPPKLQVVK